MDYISPKTNYNVNQIGHFKQLVAGAGSKVFKVNDSGIFAGAVSYGSAPFKLSYAGALTATGVDITGTIDATGGAITGDLTVTGSLLSDDGATFQTKLYAGELSFLKNSVAKAGIKTASGSNGLTLKSVGSVYFTDLTGNPNAELDANSNLKFSNDAYISWAGGRKLTADGAKITCDGGFVTTEGIGVGSSKSFSVGSDQGSTKSETGVTNFDIVIKGGIITSFTKN
jgi:hypothetical protein